jgi:NAD(P)-dependent dehydrogenase (short-subunit alcohol dehydrogenase family)
MRVFITGASSGLGLALARRYASLGATLGLVARRLDALEAFSKNAAVPCTLYVADVRDAAALRHAADDFVSKHGVPDIVIANAGVSIGTASDRSVDLPMLSKVIDTNLVGVANTFQPFLASMREARSGVLAAIASVAGYRGLPGAGAYSASKAGVIAYAESTRVELHGTGVRVSTICPGYIATAMTARNPYPMPFILSADEAASRIVRAIARKRSYAVIPWQMALIACVLRVLPNVLYDAVFARAPRKPRRET